MIELATLGLGGLVAFELATTFAALGKLRIAQRHLEQSGGVPDPLLPPRGTRVRPFRASLASGGERTGEPTGAITGEITGELTDAALSAGTVIVGFFTTGCLQCEAVCEELEEAPLGFPLFALIHAEPDDPPAALPRLVRRLSGLAQVAYLDAEIMAAFAFRDDSGFPTLVRLHNGLVIAAGHGVAELS